MKVEEDDWRHYFSVFSSSTEQFDASSRYAGFVGSAGS